MLWIAGSGIRLEPPALRRAYIVRPRLLERMRERFATPVVVLVAPAGFGKTTLLAQAVAENRLTPRGTDFWLTCDATDVAGSALADGLCQAMGVSAPGDVGGAIDRIVEAVWHRSPAEVALVIDDVHEIPVGSPGAGVLARLRSALPRNGHLVLSGRQPPPVALSRLDVQGSVVRLGQSDLLFTDVELVELGARRGVATERFATCGGWPALAELAASAGPGIEADYVWEEVLQAIPPARRRDLVLLAHVGPVDDGLATAVLGRPANVAEITAGFPLVATTAAGSREIHALWRPHLAGAATDADIAEARRRAGVHIARAGDVRTAVRVLVEAGAWDDVTDVVVDILGAVHLPVAGDVVATWLGRLPDHLVGGPLARVLNAVAAIQTDPRSAAKDLHDAADAFRKEGNEAGELACMAQLGQLAWWLEDPDRLLQLAARLFELEALGHDKAVPLARLGRALIADIAADCATVLDELDGIPPGSLHPTASGLAGWLRSTSLCHLGRLEEALEAADAALPQASQFLAPVVEAARLLALWYLGHVDEALRQLPAVVDRAEATGIRNQTMPVAATACVAFAYVGRPEAASGYLELARRFAAPDLPLADVNLVIAEAAAAVARGEEETAADALASYLERSAAIGSGLAAFAQQRSLALWYVLVPADRPAWERAELPPPFSTARDLARAVVAIRSDGRLPTSSPPLPPLDVVRSLLPLAWVTELLLAHVAAGRQEAWALLDQVWPEARSHVRRHADGPVASLARPARTALARLPAPPPGRIELTLLGPVELFRDGTFVDAPEWHRQRVRALLAALVIQRPVGRERLGTQLWPNLDGDAQSRNLRVTLTHLLRVLEPERGDRDASFLVRSHGSSLTLIGGEWFHADVWRFDELWLRATEADQGGTPSIALEAMREAVGLWRGDPSELALHDWALPEVEERRLRLVRMAARAGELLLACGDPDAARPMGEAALRCDPWCERAHHVVVAGYLASGHRRAARDALERYGEVLTELGTSPADRARKMEPLTHGIAVAG